MIQTQQTNSYLDKLMDDFFFFLNPPLNEKDGKYQSQLSHLQTQLILSSRFSEEASFCFCSIRDHLYDEDMVLPGPPNPNYIPSVFMPYL